MSAIHDFLEQAENAVIKSEPLTGPRRKVLVENVRLAIWASVMAERERCAKIADGWDMPCDPRTEAEEVAHVIAKGIRKQ